MIYTLGYILLSSLSFVLIHQMGIGLPKLLMILLATGYAIIFFHAINYKTIGNAYRRAFKMKKEYAIMLVSVLFMWGGTYLIPIYYSPAIQVFTFMLIICMCGSFFSYRADRRKIDLVVSVLCLLLLCVFYGVLFPVYSLGSFITLIFGTLMTGISAYVYIWQSHGFKKYDFKATEILAIRFWLLFFVPLLIVLGDQSYQLLSWKILGETLVLSFFTLIFPIYCAQKSIEKMGGNLHAVLSAMTPFCTFFLESAVMKTETHMIAYLSVCLALIVFIPWIQAFFSPMLRFTRMKGSAEKI